MPSGDTADDSHVGIPPPHVILTTGEGSKLLCQGDGTPKAALSLLGLSEAERTIISCMAAGIQRFLVVVAHASDQLRAHYQVRFLRPADDGAWRASGRPSGRID